MSTSLAVADQEDSIYTKMVVISPKFVLVNHMKTCIEVAQVDTKAMPYNKQLNPKEQKEWFWQDHNKEKLLIVRKRGYSEYSNMSSSSGSDGSMSDSDGAMNDKSAIIKKHDRSEDSDDIIVQ